MPRAIARVRSARRRCRRQRASQAQFQGGGDHAENAIELLAVGAESGLHRAPDARDERLACACDPARRGCAMDSVDRSNAIEPNVDHLIAQQVALACTECFERGANGSLELEAELPSEQVELRAWCSCHDLDIVSDPFPIMPSERADRRADGAHAKPGHERSTAVVLHDPW